MTLHLPAHTPSQHYIDTDQNDFARQGTTYSITLFDNDASLCGTNGASACTGTKLELGAEKVALVPKDSATFIFLTNVNGGTWELMSC